MAKEYPLEQLAFIKKKKLQEAERELRDKKEALIDEQKKLTKVMKERDEVKRHKIDKLTKLREDLDSGESTKKIEEGRNYLQIVEDKLKIEEKKVEAQEKEVQKAEEAVEAARVEMLRRQQQVEKLKEHKSEWTDEMKKELEKEEAKEADETGSSRFLLNKKKKRTK